jgi:hypothetical protein
VQYFNHTCRLIACCLPLMGSLPFVSACGAESGAADDRDERDSGTLAQDGGTGAVCTYPAAVEPMALNEILFSYRWPNSIDDNGANAELDLEKVYCNSDTQLDWGLFDYLLFVSIPAW